MIEQFRPGKLGDHAFAALAIVPTAGEMIADRRCGDDDQADDLTPEVDVGPAMDRQRVDAVALDERLVLPVVATFEQPAPGPIRGAVADLERAGFDLDGSAAPDEPDLAEDRRRLRPDAFGRDRVVPVDSAVGDEFDAVELLSDQQSTSSPMAFATARESDWLTADHLPGDQYPCVPSGHIRFSGRFA